MSYFPEPVEIETLTAALMAAANRLDAIDALHQPVDGYDNQLPRQLCKECHKLWPCRTHLSLNLTEPTGRRAWSARDAHIHASYSSPHDAVDPSSLCDLLKPTIDPCIPRCAGCLSCRKETP